MPIFDWPPRGAFYPSAEPMPEAIQRAIMAPAPAAGRGIEPAGWQIDPELRRMLRAWAPAALQEVLEEIEFAPQRQVHVANLDEEEGFYAFEEGRGGYRQRRGGAVAGGSSRRSATKACPVPRAATSALP